MTLEKRRNCDYHYNTAGRNYIHSLSQMITNREIKREFFIDKKKPILECNDDEIKERIDLSLRTIKVLMSEKKTKRKKKSTKEVEE